MHDSAPVAARTDMGLQFPYRGRESYALRVGEVPMRVVTHTFDVRALLETAWIGVLASGAARPNVLIQCPPGQIGPLVERLRAWAVHPFQTSVVTGELPLPTGMDGTTLVHDVSALTVAQQILLYDWMAPRAGKVQVIAITTVPLEPLVERGHFVQALFYRLNVLQAKADDE